MKTLITIAIVFSAALAAQVAKPGKQAPVISEKHKAAYYKADGMISKMTPSWTAANQAMTAAVNDIKGDCGSEFTPVQPTPDAEVTCVENPTAPVAPKETPKTEPAK